MSKGFLFFRSLVVPSLILLSSSAVFASKHHVGQSVASTISGASAVHTVKNQLEKRKTPLQHEQLSFVSKKYPVGAPAITMGAPAGFGLSWGQAFVGLGGLSETATSSQPDGSMAAGMGFGNASKWLGFEVATSIISINPTDGGFGEDGEWGMKISHAFPTLTGVAVGVSNVLSWGHATSRDSDLYGSVTQIIKLRPHAVYNTMPVFVTFGAGNGVFRFIEDQNANKKTVGEFASVAWWLVPQLSVGTDYLAGKWSAGISLLPVRKWPLSVVFGIYDLTHRSTNKTQFFGAIGYTFLFGSSRA